MENLSAVISNLLKTSQKLEDTIEKVEELGGDEAEKSHGMHYKFIILCRSPTGHVCMSDLWNAVDYQRTAEKLQTHRQTLENLHDAAADHKAFFDGHQGDVDSASLARR